MKRKIPTMTEEELDQYELPPFSDSAEDFFWVRSALGLMKDRLIGFNTHRSAVSAKPEVMEGMDEELFLLRCALMILDPESLAFIKEHPGPDLKEVINDIEPGFHPLMEAVVFKDYAGALFLLEKGADPNIGTEAWFPLLQADTKRDQKMVDLLVENGADWSRNIQVYEGWTGQYEKRTKGWDK